MSRSSKSRRRAIGAVVGGLLLIGAIVPAGAAASFSEYYGGYSICGSNCYVQSAAAHTFVINEGWTETGTPALACQLFNSKGANVVTHGGGTCEAVYFGGQYVNARAYNQSGSNWVVTGFAET